MKSEAAKSYFRSRRSAKIGLTKVRNDRLKQVLLRDKPEVIRLRPKHFFPFLSRGKKVYPLLPPPLPPPSLFGRDYGPWTDIHSRLTPLFTVHCFSFQPLPSPPPSHPPFLTPSWLRQLLRPSSSALLHSPAASSVLSFVDTRLSRWFEDPNRSIPPLLPHFFSSPCSLFAPLPLPPSRLIIRTIPLEHSSFRVFSHDRF